MICPHWADQWWRISGSHPGRVSLLLPPGIRAIMASSSSPVPLPLSDEEKNIFSKPRAVNSLASSKRLWLSTLFLPPGKRAVLFRSISAMDSSVGNAGGGICHEDDGIGPHQWQCAPVCVSPFSNTSSLCCSKPHRCLSVKGFTCPLGHATLPVPGFTFIIHNCLALFKQPVEKNCSFQHSAFLLSLL